MAKRWASIRRWWYGDYKSISGPESFAIYNDRHWTARAARAVLEYVREHHRWIIGTLIAIAALWIAMKSK